jgi:hypothetical protein
LARSAASCARSASIPAPVADSLAIGRAVRLWRAGSGRLSAQAGVIAHTSSQSHPRHYRRPVPGSVPASARGALSWPRRLQRSLPSIPSGFWF